MISAEEKQDAADRVEDALAEGVGEIEDMMRRKASHIALTQEQRKRIQFALDVLNKIEVQR
jgi:hypothetical protein